MPVTTINQYLHGGTCDSLPGVLVLDYKSKKEMKNDDGNSVDLQFSFRNFKRYFSAIIW